MEPTPSSPTTHPPPTDRLNATPLPSPYSDNAARLTPHLPPELLETIFRLLNQSTLRQNVNLVCKQWHLTSNRLIHRVAVWRPVPLGRDGCGVKEFQEALLDQLCERGSKVDTLECWVIDGTRHRHKKLGVTGRPWQWHDFVSAIAVREKIAMQREGRRVNTGKEEEVVADGDGDCDSSLFGTIRNLRIYGDMIRTMKMVEDLKPCFAFLESLKIEIMWSNQETIPIFTILDNGPRLKTVEIVIGRDVIVDIVQGDYANDAATSSSSSSRNSLCQQGRRRNYPLEQLIFNGLWIDFKTSEQIILSCPQLQVLKSLNISDNGNRIGKPQWDLTALQESGERLTRLARNHCPNLRWCHIDLHYYIHRQLHRDAQLIQLARTLPQLQSFSMMSCEFPMALPIPRSRLASLPRLPSFYAFYNCPPDLLQFFGHLTVLEIKRSKTSSCHWRTLNRVLCMCPNLQELLLGDMEMSTDRIGDSTLVVSSCDLDDSETPLSIDLLFDTTDQERRQREHQQQRRDFREWVLYEDDPHAINYLRVRDGYRPIPRIWSCRHSLRVLDWGMWDLDDVGEMTRHIQDYRLFGQLTVLRIAGLDLKVGQVKEEPRVPPKKRTREPLLTRLIAPSGPPERYPNDLLALKSLVYLEEFVMEVTRLPGTIVPQDFEFLRRRGCDFETIRSFPSPPPPSLSSSAQRRAKKQILMTLRANLVEEKEQSDEEDYDSEEENEFGRVDAYKDVRTFWPRLTTFHINYLRTHSLDATRALARGIVEASIRPGVVFRFKRSFNSPREDYRYW
ncbi:hypothetical protein BGZ95_005199 [Linnemannia exigua]|uniref:F-box domain-containing protein n=1 Tax=Linnemannia exigua TaxID=604196 RepID=A0AAD4HC22_9FUNG|nr:hypothetical protein BGZ95_005199 [Linnemannia exigua]